MSLDIYYAITFAITAISLYAIFICCRRHAIISPFSFAGCHAALLFFL